MDDLLSRLKGYEKSLVESMRKITSREDIGAICVRGTYESALDKLYEIFPELKKDNKTGKRYSSR